MILKRIAENKDGTFGVLLDGDVPFAVTLERQWRENQREISCIPEGSYTCKRVLSPRFGETFEITGIIGRTNILFHKGNTSDDTHGCILVAESFATLNNKTSIADSAGGFGEFMARSKGADGFAISIIQV
ncbi:MAG: hypothetical protein HY880_04170 [Deltaproteobacteria bacterium]|nr:hypothetical protein [Deltaproteobacteria bacterium]